MPFLSYEQVAATVAIKTVVALSIPNNTTKVELQANGNPVNYTMDNATDPTQTVGMVLTLYTKPETFLVQDVKRIRFVRGAATNGTLNLHYFTGRDV